MNSPVEAFLFDQAQLADEVYTFATSEKDFAENYYNYPSVLAKLVKAMARLSLALKRFQKIQVEGLGNRVDIASGLFIDFQWAQDADSLTSIFTTHLPEALMAGALMSQAELGQVLDFSPNDLPAQRFLETHIPKLSGELVTTTKERIANNIKQGITAGLDRDGIADSLADVIDSPVRRQTIVSTESVRAFSEGRIQAGIAMGADRKRWKAQIVRCPLCADLDGKEVGIIEVFFDGTFAPPRHPRCQCGATLVFSPSRDTSPERIAFLQKQYLRGLAARF